MALDQNIGPLPSSAPHPPPRLPTARLEALRAAASVHRGKGSSSTDVLNAAERYERWLEGHAT